MKRSYAVAMVAAVGLVSTFVASGSVASATHGTGSDGNAAPVVSGPLTGGNGSPVLAGTTFDLGSVGYRQSEFLLSGTASAYQPTGSLGSDGKWSVVPSSSAPYTTRIVVNRPADPSRFNGTVVVEWLNVSLGSDTAPDWGSAHDELIRSGYAWVGVSAQAVGVNATKAADPVRYAALSHPGDSYSYDIFTQAAEAVQGSAAKVLGGLKPQTTLASGESQSAFRMVTYINAVHPLVHVFNGFLVHSRGGNGAPLSQAPEQPDVPVPDVVRIRTDLSAPVLTFETETDLLILGYLPARQPDTAKFRLWEMAGTAHADTYALVVGPGDTGTVQGDVDLFNTMLNPPSSIFGFTCGKPINSGQQHYVLQTAYSALNRWVRTGQAPPQADRLQVAGGSTPAFVVDVNGNVRGGIRTPSVDTPVATLSGLGQPVDATQPFCALFGTTTPFTPATLAAHYPSHGAFVQAWQQATVRAVNAGFVLPADAAGLRVAAQKSTVGG
jgi:hypothetical protein